MIKKSEKIKPLALQDITVEGSFWRRYMELIRKEVIPYQWDILNDRVKDAAKSSCIKNFEIAAGKTEGKFYGMVFQDSDLYKWLESVAYTLAAYPDAQLEKLADDAIKLISEAQTSDGYVNTHYTDPETRWTNLQHGHELYCAGHLIEAAIAYHDATGKTTFLDIAKRFADCIDKAFGLDDGKINGYPGHQEIELALYKLFEVTKEKRYLNLAAYFINQRGKKPYYFLLEKESPKFKEVFPELLTFDHDYFQAGVPPIEQRVATGHSVRAVYMYCAMADLASELEDKALASACEILYRDITEKQMYVTGAIGSAESGERFTTAYDLPNDLIYGETCASVGLMM
ncbi:MAG: glycoside hydrolase family 127 protein, partial [Defluviitaleaceae bacterium]|nr:glycoside hydrolase family 127 protein [Defluviitaleaceae bacterium]